MRSHKSMCSPFPVADWKTDQRKPLSALTFSSDMKLWISDFWIRYILYVLLKQWNLQNGQGAMVSPLIHFFFFFSQLHSSGSSHATSFHPLLSAFGICKYYSVFSSIQRHLIFIFMQGPVHRQMCDNAHIVCFYQYRLFLFPSEVLNSLHQL